MIAKQTQSRNTNIHLARRNIEESVLYRNDAALDDPVAIDQPVPQADHAFAAGSDGFFVRHLWLKSPHRPSHHAWSAGWSPIPGLGFWYFKRYL